MASVPEVDNPAVKLAPLTSGRGGGMVVKKKTKAKSKLISKFKNREVDPFAAQNKLVLQDMEEGFRQLMDLHNPAELSSLCALLGQPSEGMTSEEKKDQIIDSLKGPGGSPPTEKDYIEMMKMMWEGCMFEYLRAVGQPLRTAEQDPRGFIIRYWRRRVTDPRNQEFVPYYLPRKFEVRSGRPRHDRDIGKIVEEIAGKEIAVKQAEQCLRRENDYRFVLRYFTAVSELHDAQKRGMDFMTAEAEMLRARMEHCEQNFSVTAEQLEELEYRHEVLKDRFVARGAFEGALADTLLGTLGRNCGDRAAALGVVRGIYEDLGRVYREEEGGGGGDDLAAWGLVPGGVGADGVNPEGTLPDHGKYDLVRRLEDLRGLTRDELGRLDAATRAAVARMKEAQGALQAAQDEGARQRARAERAEADLAALGRKFRALMEYSAQRGAEAEATAEVFLQASGDAGVLAARHAAGRQAAAPLLLRLAEEGPEQEHLAVTLMEALGVMTRAGALCHLEQRAMMREDMVARTAAATAGVDLAKAGGGGGKKKGAKGGGKRGASPARKKR